MKILLTALVLTFGFLTGCNTIEGAGNDIEQAGEAISDKASETRDDM